MKIKAALSASIGGAFEWYDFIIYGFFIQVFGHQFYPQHDVHTERLIGLLIFAVGFFARPIGGLVFGYVGDIYGRSRSLYYSMILIGIATFCVAVMPTYSLIGPFSIVIFILLRICQGFAVGGSISGSFVYIAELSDPHSRSFWVSTAFIGNLRGIIFAGVISGFLFTYLSSQQLHDWGWRVAFLFGTLIILLARYTGYMMVETPYHQELHKNNLLIKSPIRTLFKDYKLVILQCMGLTASHAILTIFILLFMPTFLQEYGLSHKEALHINLIAIMVLSTLLPLFGWFGNKIKLSKMLIIGCILLIFLAYPALQMIANHHMTNRIIGILILTIIDCLVSSALPPLIVGLFPTGIRYCGVSFGYNLSVAVIAGTAPLIISVLGKWLNSIALGTSIIIIISSIITLFSILTPRIHHLPVIKKRF